MFRQENLANLILMSAGQLQMQPKGFHSYSFIKFSRNEAFGHFLVDYIEWLAWKQQLLLLKQSDLLQG